MGRRQAALVLHLPSKALVWSRIDHFQIDYAQKSCTKKLHLRFCSPGVGSLSCRQRYQLDILRTHASTSRERHINTTMRIVRALAALAAQPRGTRRLLTVRFASNNAVADAEVLAGLSDPVIIDVRDRAEVEAGKGGPPASVPGALHVPLNIDGQRQSERPTTQEEFLAAVAAAGLALPRDRPVVTHCGSGGRGGKAAELLCDAGYDAYNGGGPAHVASALAATRGS